MAFKQFVHFMRVVLLRSNQQGASAPIFLDDKKMNYPKMLYKGNQEKYQTVIADDEDHESELVDQGWLEYGELPEREQGMEDPHMESVKSSILEVGEFQYNSEVEAHSQTKLKLETANTEIERLNQIIAVGRAENADLREQLTFFQNEGPKLTESAGDQLTKAPVDYSELSVKELQNLLDEKQIKYLKNDNKAALLALLG